MPSEKEFKSTPKVSVVMSVYNTERFVAQSIESILKQTFTDFEFIIFDDASTDKSAEIIQSYADKDSRIRFFKCKTNQKLIPNLNKGLEVAKGGYIARMDADDISLPNRFEKQVRYLDKHKNVAVVGSSVKTIDKDNNESKGWILDANVDETRVHFLFTNYVINPSTMLRKSMIPDGGYGTEYVLAEDFDLWTRIIAKYDIYSLPEPLIKYRIHDKNISSDTKKNYPLASKILRRQLDKLGLNPTNDEVEFHHSTSDFILDGKNIKDISNWYRKIWAHNNTAGIYKKHVLLSTMSGRMFLISRRIGGLSEVMRFTLDCTKDLSTYEKLKFFYLSFKRLISYLI